MVSSSSMTRITLGSSFFLASRKESKDTTSWLAMRALVIFSILFTKSFVLILLSFINPLYQLLLGFLNFQPSFCINGCHTPGSRRCNRLTVHMILNVPGSKNPRDFSISGIGLSDQITCLIHVQHSLK